MKPILLSLLFLCVAVGADAQYYYKDQIVSRQAAAQILSYKDNHVRKVRLNSFESDGEPTEQFEGSQQLDQNFQRLVTTLKSTLTGETQLTSYFNAAGQLVKTTDTTDGSGSNTQFFYDDHSRLNRVVNYSVSPGSHSEKEEHIWTFENDKPAVMVRIKDDHDTTTIKFVLDEKGNVAEENSVRGSVRLPSFYYYYNDKGQLTDVAAYNRKAQRLLPAYTFDYNADGLVQSMMVVPEGSSDYQKSYYEYRNGLKAKETVFNKRKQLLGHIEYTYE